MNKPLRILMVLHMTWDIDLGGPKTQMELAEYFRSLGHTVEKFDYYDAFPESKRMSPRLWQLIELFSPSFSMKAKAFIQKNADRFDIIDAHQGNLPFSKQRLKFSGLLVARSVGLYAFYQEFEKLAQKKWPETQKTNIIKFLLQQLYIIKEKREARNFVPSLQYADRIIVPNNDELKYVSDVLPFASKSSCSPMGLTPEQHLAYAQSAQSADIRLANQQVVFIGAWGSRKGSKDWPEIIRRVRERMPKTKFLFLGTGYTAEKILEDLQITACDWMEIVPSYKSSELPAILSGATVGGFPSHIEGFGIAVLEQLSAGLPLVAYDVPGPRAMLDSLDRSLMTPVGDVNKFSEKLIELLSMDQLEYVKLSQQCSAAVQRFNWPEIAKETLDMYEQALASK